MTLQKYCLPIAAFIAAFFLTKNSFAENGGFCVTTQEAMKAVATEKEQLVFRGLSKRGHLVTIYLGPKKSFTALIHYQTGKSCFVDFGAEGEVMVKPSVGS